MIRDLRLSANGQMNVVRKIPILNHRTGDFRVGIETTKAKQGGNFLLISQHSKHIREVRAGLDFSIVSGGVKSIRNGVQTAIKCTGKKVIVTTYRDGTKQVVEEVDNG